MSTNSSLMQIGTLEVLVVRKPIKNLHLSVLPPDGKIRVTSPIKMKDDVIRTLIATRLPWIHKHRIKFISQERQTPRKYISGESHYYLGKRYVLELIEMEMPPIVSLKGGNKIILRVRPKTSLAKKEEVMTEWYRETLRDIANELIPKWEKKIGVHANTWGIKRMKTRWGTCNQKAQRVWLNLELAKRPMEHIEYVVVHELAHLIEKKHDERFVRILSQHIPKWRDVKNDLNRQILSHETWR